jgi:hypothetical protein
LDKEGHKNGDYPKTGLYLTSFSIFKVLQKGSMYDRLSPFKTPPYKTSLPDVWHRKLVPNNHEMLKFLILGCDGGKDLGADTVLGG